MKHFYYNLKAFIKNLPLFLKLAWNWRKWDSTFTIDVLIVLIKEHAKDQLADKWHVNRVKRYRQAMTAAGLLEQAYGDYHHPSEKYLSSKVRYTVGSLRFVVTYDGNKDMLDKMSDLAYNKGRETVKARKDYAWDYLNRHIERMWS